jgi:glycosyltransferase involved in cell wall biosynthesis
MILALMPHRILHIIPTLDQAGAEKQLALLCAHLPRDEFDLHVCALTRGGPWQDALQQSGVPVTVIGKKWKLDPAALLRLYRLLRTWSPDLVHTWIFAANCYGRCAARWANVPHIVASERCVDQWKTWHELAFDRYLARRTDAIVVNSHGTRHFYAQHGIPRDKFIVIPNAIEVPDSPPADYNPLDHNRANHNLSSLHPRPWRSQFHIPEQARLIVAIGRLWPQKRIKDLIWAADLLKGVRTDTHLLIVGDGPQRALLERYRRVVQIEDLVHFAGHRDDVAAILRDASCFWLASGYEGQSNALMEAMSIGVPVVATDITGNRELVQHDQSGFLVPVGDSAAFARRTQQILNDPALAARLGAAARKTMAEQFRVDTMVQHYVHFYRKILHVEGPVHR